MTHQTWGKKISSFTFGCPKDYKDLCRLVYSKLTTTKLSCTLCHLRDIYANMFIFNQL